MIDKFVEMATEVEIIKLAENLRYALAVIENVNGNLKAEDTLDMMKKELRMTYLHSYMRPTGRIRLL